MSKIDKLDAKLSEKIDKLDDKLTNRIDKIGKQLAYLEVISKPLPVIPAKAGIHIL